MSGGWGEDEKPRTGVGYGGRVACRTGEHACIGPSRITCRKKEVRELVMVKERTSSVTRGERKRGDSSRAVHSASSATDQGRTGRQKWLSNGDDVTMDWLGLEEVEAWSTLANGRQMMLTSMLTAMLPHWPATE